MRPGGPVGMPRYFALPTVLLGLGGVTASAFIYLVPARPAWNNWHTLVDFYLTGLRKVGSFHNPSAASIFIRRGEAATPPRLTLLRHHAFGSCPQVSTRRRR
jgi:hypothetical protein